MIKCVEINRVLGGYETIGRMHDGTVRVMTTPGQKRFKQGRARGVQTIIRERLELREKLGMSYEVVAYNMSWKLQDGKAVLK
jgi:hypothetical protein